MSKLEYKNKTKEKTQYKNDVKSLKKIENQDLNNLKGLAIESATKTASVALIEGDKILAEMTLNGKLNHSETLVPMIDNICKLAEFEVKDLDFIAVSKGPGSYTGLRIGISVAKGIARVAGAKIVGVSTLDTLAMNMGTVPKSLENIAKTSKELVICPMIDARRKHAYCTAYELSAKGMTVLIEPELRSVEEFVAQVNELKRRALYLGDGTLSHRELLLEYARGVFVLGSDRENTPLASVLAKIGLERYKTGKGMRYSEFVPDYFRNSQAKRMMNENK